MIDTHCHLDRVADLGAALDNELAALVTIGTDAARSRAAIALAAAEPRVFASVGVHPSEAATADDPAVRDAVERLAREPGVVAIGETGFDTYWARDALDAQRRSFAWQAELARELDLPLVLHVRDGDGRDDASSAASEMLHEHGWGRGILHCCNGHEGLIGTGLALGWFVSFAGNLTYPRARALHAAAAAVPEERLLVETDAPYLAPVPFRGKRNLPGYVVHTASALARLRGADPALLEARLDANARRCYALPSS
jgi:TatD DNase family protein